MQDENNLNRRQFLGAAAAALFAGVTITVLGCGEDSGTDAPTGSGDLQGEIANNHPSPHKAVLTKAQIDAGGAVTLHIQGLSGHDHVLELTADDFATLKKSGMITVNSAAGGSDGHTHSVMFM
jgi:hypothetical protein